jgi:hypothetical protein
MTNADKLKEMGFADYSFIRSPISILVSDRSTGIHGANCVKTVEMVGNYCNKPLNITYHGDRTKAIEKAEELGIKVISQSLGFTWSEDYKAKVKRFIANGGIIVNSAGNEGNEDTTVPKDLAIIVGTIYDRDNGGSDVVSHTGWRLPEVHQGIDNIFVATSSATPVVAYAVAILKQITSYNLYEMKSLLKRHAKFDSRLEEGEVLLQMPEIKKTEIKLEINGKAYINGVEKPIDVPAQIINGRTLVPFRFIGEALGCDVSYTTDANNKVKDVTLAQYSVL